MQLPPLSYEIAANVEQLKGDHLESWIRGMQHNNKQFFGVEIVQIDHVRMFAARHLQEIGLFNVVVGLSSQDAHLLPEIVRFYHDRAIQQYHLEINPYRVNATFLESLARSNFVLSAFQTYLYGIPQANAVSFPFSLTTVRDIAPSEIDLFADLHLQGFREALARIPEETSKRYRAGLKVLYQLPGWYLSLILIKNIPVGMSMLYTQNEMALLAGGAVVAEHRKQGGHMASLQHRFQTATRNQCTLVAGQASVGSQSQQNMQQFQMQTIYTGTNWIHHDK